MIKALLQIRYSKLVSFFIYQFTTISRPIRGVVNGDNVQFYWEKRAEIFARDELMSDKSVFLNLWRICLETWLKIHPRTTIFEFQCLLFITLRNGGPKVIKPY